jgi:putative transcriptional regulator
VSPEQVRALRTRLGLTQAGMAARLGVHLRTYQQWEYGRRTPSAAARKLLEGVAREANKGGTQP